MPMISGFLLTGLFAGPSALGFLSHDQLTSLQPLDHFALGFIALIAGSELGLDTLKQRWGAILGVMSGLILITCFIGAGSTLLVSEFIPFLSEASWSTTIAAALLVGVIMTARSPSSAIAIINEQQASGPFTQLVLGVTVLMDVAVITLFALGLSVAHSLIDGRSLSLDFVSEVGLELATSFSIGLCVGGLVLALFKLSRSPLIRLPVMIAAPMLMVFGGEFISHLHLTLLDVPIHVEPLLACVIAGVTLNLAHRDQCHEVKASLEKLAPAIYVAFFTLTGASLELSQLMLVWPAALLLFTVRLIGIYLGATIGGFIAGEPREQHAYRWMGFVTQAGVGLGLAKRVAIDFPGWGNGFAMMMIAVIVLNEMIGPLFFKKALIKSGETQST